MLGLMYARTRPARRAFAQTATSVVQTGRGGSYARPGAGLPALGSIEDFVHYFGQDWATGADFLHDVVTFFIHDPKVPYGLFDSES